MRSSVTFSQQTLSNDILYTISTSNLVDLKKYITEANVNDTIDRKNGYTSLHHAIRMNDEKIVKFILDMGADPYIRTSIGEDAIDLSLKYQSKVAIKYMIDDKIDTISILRKSILNLETKNKNLEASSDHLSKSFLKVSDDKSKLFTEKQSLITENKTLKKTIDRNEVTISSLREDNHKLDGDVKSLKRKYSDLETKYDDLDHSFTVLLKSTKR
jgi:FtsZ-binding cell division protein ZapB